LFLSLLQDPPNYPEELMRACERLGIPAQELPLAEVLQGEPSLTPHIKRAICVPDASIDPFRLIRANVEEAERLGAKFFPHRQVESISTNQGSIHGLRARDSRTGEEFHLDCRFLVNAAGVWAGRIGQLAGAPLEVVFSKGSLIVLNQRLVSAVINRCRPPSSGDILVPHGPALIIGTTSQNTEEIEDPAVEEDEVDLLLTEGGKMVPQVSSTRVIRAYAGVRPLMGAREADGDSRKISRDFLLVNHGETDGLKGFFSIVGGKLTTYRLMAERTVDALCQEMGNKTPCSTAQRLLPFPEEYNFHDLGSRLRRLSTGRSFQGTEQIICECELVSKQDILQEIQSVSPISLTEVQKRTRAGMGPCQGGFCSHRLTALLVEAGILPPGASLLALKHFLEERWKGIRPVLWGPQLREEQLIQALYTELFNLDHP